MKEIISEFSTVIKLEAEEPKQICKLGQGEECCAFLVVGPKGFECIRMSYPSNSMIFDRLEKGTINAKGQGRWANCPWVEL